MAIVVRLLFTRFLTIPNLTVRRSIMTSQPKLEKAVEELKKNPYFEKYSTKIATLQQTSPEEFLSRVEAQEKKKSEPKFGGIKERYKIFKIL